jgi:hypothetical protein
LVARFAVARDPGPGQLALHDFFAFFFALRGPAFAYLERLPASRNFRGSLLLYRKFSTGM